MTQPTLFDDAGATWDGQVGRPLLSASELARRLGQRHGPTEEQARAIEHLGSDGRPAPYLVVAGAGSGKTETMAARVVWLVANRIVRPERILGLTFTRKAAGELATRIRARLGQLAASGILALDRSDDWLDGEPTVATYHGYAASLFGEHAIRIGREPSARLLGEAMTWQYAGRVVAAHSGDMPGVDWAPSTVVGAIRALAGDLAEHLGSPADVRSFTDALIQRVESIPRASKQRTPADRYRDTEEFLAAQRRRSTLLPLVEAYEELKASTGSIDFGDQVALAARIAREHDVVGGTERSRWDVVLLDEYQDTGTAQRVLLSTLFGTGHAVTAVGDPCQSIYGWRGASAGNLRRFPTDFPARDGQAADVVELTTSFRNGGQILAVANHLSADLRHHGIPVRNLRPGPKGESSGHVVHACLLSSEDEAEWVAERIDELVVGGPGQPARYRPGQVAVLTRARSQFPRLEEALRRRDIPVELSGIGGLITTPEVADVIATLRVLSDPSAGASMIRLLTGARWRLGPRDLAALGERARQLARPVDGAARVALQAARARPGADSVDEGSLVEALDEPGPAHAYSSHAWPRICALRSELRALRSRADAPLPDVVADIIRTTRLDVEVAAVPRRDATASRAHLDRFLDVAAEFSESEEGAGIPAFLAYLDAAADYERGLDLGRAPTSTDAVSLLTMHGAKGLEWPVVVVPGMTKDVFPSRPRESTDWCANAKTLPFALRGDAGDLPELELARCRDQVEVKACLKAHRDDCRERDRLEERRLMYVAATRAEDLLICTGYWWDHTTRPRGPSIFLTEVRDTCATLGIGTDAGWVPEPLPDAENPLARKPREALWPYDPLPADRRAGLRSGADLVLRALDAAHGAARDGVESAARDAAHGAARDGVENAAPQAPDHAPLDPRGLHEEEAERIGAWHDEIDKLLAERAAAGGGSGAVEVELPAHLSVSQLVQLRRDPRQLARSIRRPVPLPPAPLARRGTAFHAWLERRYGGARLLDIDELPGSADAAAVPDEDLALLRRRFLASAWAERLPVEGGVEVPFEMDVCGVLVRGRMDAVFRDDDGSFVVVDWKTGAPPVGDEAHVCAVQLAAYRLAWHRLTGAPLHEIRAAFHYVRTGETVAPVDLLDETGLEDLVRGVPPPGHGGVDDAESAPATS